MTLGGSAISARIRLDSLTGLRAIAALVVFGTHAAGQIPDSPLATALDPFFLQGNVGVSFFFVLSGFVLMWSHREEDKATAFYLRRFARIAPAYWMALAIGLALQLLANSRLAMDSILLAAPSVLGLQSWFPNAGVYHAANGVGWSLSTEAFFYLLFPVLAVCLRRRTLVMVLLLVAAAMVVIVPAVLRPEVTGTPTYWAIYILPVQRFAEFVCGAVLATGMRAGWRFPVQVLPATGLALVAYMIAAQVPIWAGIYLVTFVPFIVLIGAAAQSDLDGRASLLRSRAMIVMGEWSYSFYLLHTSVILVLIGICKRLDAGFTVTVAALLVALVVSWGSAFLLYRWVERPMERKLRGLGPRLLDATGGSRPHLGGRHIKVRVGKD